MLWIDVTDLARWKGPATGIPRVLEQLGTRLHKNSPNQVSYCVYSEQKEAYISISVDEVEGRTSRLERNQPANDPPAARLPSRVRAKRIMGKFLARLQPNTQVYLKDFLRSGLHLAKTFKSLMTHLLARSSPRFNPENSKIFNSGDALLLLGSSWGIADLPQKIWQIKNLKQISVIPMIYDLIPVKFPHFYGPGFPPVFQRWLVDIIWCADEILTDSIHSSQDILEFSNEFQLPTRKISVIRLADEISNPSSQPPLHLGALSGESTLQAPYALCVGTLEVRKNQALLLFVWKQLIEKHELQKIPQLIWVGRLGWLESRLQYWIDHDPQLAGKIKILENVSDSVLSQLYQSALFTLYPSFYEGWGLPIGESLAHGKYCIASNSSSMPEVGGDLADYVSPNDPTAWVNLIERAIFDVSYLKEKEKRIRDHFKLTRWDDTAQQLAQVLKRYF